MTPLQTTALGLGALVAAGCATQSTAGDYASVRTLTRARAGLDLPIPSRADASDADADVEALLRQPLTAATAVRIALLNNRDLRAELESLGIARGQLAQVSVVPNPEFELAVLFPEGSEGDPKWELGAGIDLTDLILLGPRADVAEAQLEAGRLRVASAVLDLALQVRLELYRVLASQQNLELMRAALTAFAAGYETAQAMHAAGNITDLDLVTEHAAYETARIAVAESEAELLERREQLNVLLGLHGPDTDWTLEGRLPDVPADVPEARDLEARAIEASLQLAETRARLRALSSQVGLARNQSWLPDLTVGVSAEYEESSWAVGPALSGTLPFFDRQQGTVQMHRAEFEQLRERYVATAVRIRSAVRAARNRAVSARERVRHYRELVLPLRQRVLRETILEYNAMQVGVFQVLQARRDELEAARNYVETLREYWSATAELEQILAGRLPSALGGRGEEAGAESLPSASGGGGH